MPCQWTAVGPARRTGSRPVRRELSRYFLPVKNSLMFSPLNLAPSTTVWPMPANISLNPRPTWPWPICLAPRSTRLVAWSTLVLSAAPAVPHERARAARNPDAIHIQRSLRVMRYLRQCAWLTSPGWSRPFRRSVRYDALRYSVLPVERARGVP